LNRSNCSKGGRMTVKKLKLLFDAHHFFRDSQLDAVIREAGVQPLSHDDLDFISATEAPVADGGDEHGG